MLASSPRLLLPLLLLIGADWAWAAGLLLDVAPDTVSLHMMKLYQKYQREGNRPRDGNTVRSFRAVAETVDQRLVYRYNLSSLQDSEVVLAATFHFFFDKLQQTKDVLCKRSKNASCRLLHAPQMPRLSLTFQRISQSLEVGFVKLNMTLMPQRRGTWLMKDITPIIKESKKHGELHILAELHFSNSQTGMNHPVPTHMPYIMVYANDLAISEPNSVSLTLQRYDPFPSSGGDPSYSPNTSSDTRVRREALVSGSIHDNELPEVNVPHFNKHELWESAYQSLKPRTSRRDRRKKGQEVPASRRKTGVLHFDDKTMKKARRRQWNEPRFCSRRYLKVDFADIGWSEWVLSPKSFDAYYCAGVCEFPMPKIVRPSNHATIQSIVKTVGIIPGIPEPCCVPDKMNSLSVLFLDESRNVVLKVYPNMSVATCACR
ncbi:growth/differentiation factor 10 [Ambystoma mexicanum]|uniref:growth/differentiation factor 10 n=1 Tax=Ambystoma mexicanum TaxID=8296 RepID=UPI0037E79622